MMKANPKSKFLIYRKLEERDFGDVSVLYTALVDDVELAPDHVQFSKVISQEGSAIYGAELDGRIVAMATLHVLPNLSKARPVYCLVENVVTLRAFQGQGLGRCVMNAVIEAAWAAGAYKIMLLTGSDAGAKGFYEKLGFSAESKIGMQMRRVPARKITKR
jgi:GNAT superfamily N-acetyltransferase